MFANIQPELSEFQPASIALFSLSLDDIETTENQYNNAINLKENDPIAQNNLGVMYYYGKGITQDFIKAREWCEKAAKQGLDKAQYNLGVMYYYGRGITQDFIKAREWFEKADKQNDSIAQFILGVMYSNNKYGEVDFTKSKIHYEQAAELGNPKAQFNLGMMCINKKYGETDFTKAIKNFEKAAERGIVDAQFTLGVMYSSGIEHHTNKNTLVPKDYKKAKKYLEEAIKLGNKHAKNELDKVIVKIEEQKAQVCAQEKEHAKEIKKAKESIENMGSREINLVNTFASLSVEEQERAIKFSSLSENKQISLLNDFEQSSKPDPLEKLRENYKTFPKSQKITVDNVISHLKPQLKLYIKAWGAIEDSFYLNDLREIEPKAEKMYQSFYRAHKKDESSPLLSDLIPTLDKKIDKKIDNFSPTKDTSYKEYRQLASAIIRREQNNESSLKPHPI